MANVNVKPNWVRGSCIGRGSFGTVNLAVDKTNGRVFAVKSVEQSNSLLTQVEALENEIRILRSLSSPFVVKYIGDDVNFESTGVSYRNLHLEYLPGGNVDELGDETTLSSFTRCIVSALKYVHALGIVHCDVKGKNVLVGPTPGTAKLADFGSAMKLSSASLPMNSTRGSPLWMAPEVIRGEYQGPESDVWSLGCTVIEMITGKPAWEDRGVDTVVQIGYSNQLPKFPAQWSELCRDFLQKCLRREREERWSCDQLLQHPFLSCSSQNMNIKWSPRCVFDWSDSNFSDEDDEEFENLNSDAKQRIGKLVSKTGANWESDGWTVVRNLISERDEVTEACGDEGEEGTNSTYPDLTRSEEIIGQSVSEYSDSVEISGRTNWEYSDNIASLHRTNYANGVAASRKNNTYSCYRFVSLLYFLLYNCIFISNIIYEQSFSLREYKILSFTVLPHLKA